ncbi:MULTISPECIES: EAL and HDOD domain-containing protein [unclassified Butyrivibrio]|uniref:EAL and HDOD domain-containing protein n=1 Tax=unclassified Butyrivibrio TaxID=2639466 RepID=UPI0003FEAF64|nr:MULTISPECIES: HDOD domain-containing protein [unclassified Butyrivibrio]
MLASLIPLFDDEMRVCAYSVFAQRDNHLMNPHLMGTGFLDNVVNIVGLDIVDSVGPTVLSGGKEVFVEINNISLFANIEEQCKAPQKMIVLLLDSTVLPEEPYLTRLWDLKGQGYKIAIRKLAGNQFETYKPILEMCDYILLDHRKINIRSARIYFQRAYPELKLCAVGVDSKDDYERLSSDGAYDLYEGNFFRVPVEDSEKTVTPLKVTYIELLNVVNNPDFDLQDAADVIGKDPALVISLLEMVNHLTINSEITSVRHAAAMLGQKELKRWINTAVTKELCADKPSEIMRISMVRAKFAENLSACFDLKGFAAELFLAGLFSLLDIMLDQTMEQSLKLVHVSKKIEDALIGHKGDLWPILQFMFEYENASWQEVSRLMIMENIDMNEVYKAYTDALRWYRDLIDPIK